MIDIERVINDIGFYKEKLQNGIYSDRIYCLDVAISMIREADQYQAIGEPDKKKIIADVLAERKRQDEKWGEQDHRADTWVSIIGEEYGEMCKAVNEFGFDPKEETISDIYTEAIQTMASCMAMLECIERSRH